jgi:hypothetical protein
MTIGTKQTLSCQNEELTLTINSEQLQHSACEDIYQKEHFRFVFVVFSSIRHIRIEKS